ncbi:MAG TPA: hypothetical protein VK177_17775 [Flavobacteriales bacterium]|nr:hypothetical protein [Flavobacteriales bacterium]
MTSAKSQELLVGTSGYIYKQELKYDCDNNNCSYGNKTELNNTKISSQSLNFSLAAIIKKLEIGITYFEYKMHLSFEGKSSYSWGAKMGSGRGSSVFEFDAKEYYKSFLVSAGVILFKSKKINVIPSFGFGAERRFRETQYLDHAILESFGTQYSLSAPPTSSHSQKESFDANSVWFATNHAVLRVVTIKARYNFTKEISADLHGGMKSNKEPKFSIGIYKESVEWFYGVGFNFKIGLKIKKEIK